MRHGKGQKFSCAGILVVANYWRLNGHKVIGFLPDYLTDMEKVAQQEQLMVRLQLVRK